MLEIAELENKGVEEFGTACRLMLTLTSSLPFYPSVYHYITRMRILLFHAAVSMLEGAEGSAGGHGEDECSSARGADEGTITKLLPRTPAPNYI